MREGAVAQGSDFQPRANSRRERKVAFGCQRATAPSICRSYVTIKCIHDIVTRLLKKREIKVKFDLERSVELPISLLVAKHFKK